MHLVTETERQAMKEVEHWWLWLKDVGLGWHFSTHKMAGQTNLLKTGQFLLWKAAIDTQLVTLLKAFPLILKRVLDRLESTDIHTDETEKCLSIDDRS